MKKIVSLFLTYFLLTCSHSINENSDGAFGIFLLKDSTVTAASAYEQPMENLVLSEKPFISANDLKSYMWTSHSFELKDQKRAEFENFLLQKGSTRGVPFVVTVGEDRIYFGTFWWAYSSSLPPACAIIEAIAPLPYKIQSANGAIDKRSDMRIYNSLKNSGVLVF